MKNIYIPTASAEDWKKTIATSAKHWKDKHSAKELAKRWENANGFPVEFKNAFAKLKNTALHDPEMLLAIPEYKVELPGKGYPSKSDLFVLARTHDDQLAVIMVEGKVNEPFGETLAEWLANDSANKRERLKEICKILGVTDDPPIELRYQLLHRLASALITAQKFNAQHVFMIVHSFSPEHRWLADYQKFLKLFNVEGQANEMVALPTQANPRVYTGWVVGELQP